MGFWIIAGLLAIAVGALLMLALLRGRAQVQPTAAYDMQVYRDQLAEVDRDLARGVVTEGEAARIRTEVSRRLLEADRAAGVAGVASDAPQGVSRVAAVLVGLAVIVGAGGLYGWLGAPGYADLPLKVRIADADAARATRPTQAEAEAEIYGGEPFVAPVDVDPATMQLIEELRQKVAERPDDLRGHMFLAESEARLQNFVASHQAQSRVIALKGADATSQDYAVLAYLLVLAAGEYVSPEAEAAINTTLKMEPRNGLARYFLGLMYAQNDRADLALGVWRPLLAESQPNAPWTPWITGQIAQVAQAAGVRYDPPRMADALPGPNAEDMAAAAEMETGDRMQMIRGMVEGLAERLASDGGTPEEWARLVNALGVLGEKDRAAAIWAEAQQVFANTPDAIATIRAAAARAGVAE